MCYNGTFRFKKLDDSFWNGETFRFADYTMVTAFLRNSHLPIFVLTTSAILLLLLITEVAFNFE